MSRSAFIGRAFVTPHAVRRWQARIHPGVTYRQAIAEIIEALVVSTLLRTDPDGTQHWRASRRCRWGRLRMRMRPGTGELPAIVTILPEWGRGRTTP